MPRLVTRWLVSSLLVTAQLTSTQLETAMSQDSADPVRPAASQDSSVRLLRSDDQWLIHVNDAAGTRGWEAKIVKPGKLLTLCRDGEQGVCIPVRLDQHTHRVQPEGLYLDAARIERILRVRLTAAQGTRGTLVDATDLPDQKTRPADGYNVVWPEGRGFRVGQRLPDIPLSDLDGNEVRFGKFLGKRYILYCWASW